MKYFKEFKESTTVIPLTGDEEIDAKIKKVFENKWTFTKLKYVDLKSIGKYYKEGYSIINITTFTIDNGVIENTSLCLYLPDYNINSTRMLNVIASVPINCSSSRGNKKYTYENECVYQDIAYKLDILYEQIIEIVNFVEEEKYKPVLAHFSGINKYAKLFNKKRQKTLRFKKSKTLILPAKVFSDKYTEEDFKENYNYDFEVLSDKNYKKAINAKNPEHLILFFNNTPNGTLNVYDFECQCTVFINLNFAKSPTPSKSKLTRLNAGQVKELNKYMSAIFIK